MTDIDRGQVTKSAAQVYDEFFLPALFAQWAPVGCEHADDRRGPARPRRGLRDRRSGPGRQGAVGPAGSVAGVDINDGMLEVARRADPTIDWRCARPS